MRTRQPLPRHWLLTDERLGDRLFPALERLPEGAGVVFRHYSLEEPARRRLFEAVRAVTEARDLVLLLAGPADRARLWGADGSHGRGAGAGLRSAPVHNYSELRGAERAGADFVFMSPVFATQSHPGSPGMGLARFAWLARRTRLPVIALGGMNQARGRTLASFGAYGWGAIDAWAGDQGA
ncbi:MAG TPA: thiamine phosphate synthase [Allosphingosinicella sp.]|nr:thiamine phosphate synthase [Allosphingosinicella sp.]